MPRARSPQREKSFELWINSGGKRELKDIAAELGVSAEQVRKWKCCDKWDAKTQKVTLPNGKGHVTKRKRGGQPGNKNATGNSGGAPAGNTNHFKHGLYMGVYLDALTDEEQALVDAIPDDEEVLLEEQIALLSIRERRLLKIIQEYKSKTVYVESVEKEDTKQKVPRGKDPIDIVTNIFETKRVRTTASISVIERAEAELTRVQGKKTKVIEALSRLRAERKREEQGNETNALADDWIAAMMEVDDAED